MKTDNSAQGVPMWTNFIQALLAYETGAVKVFERKSCSTISQEEKGFAVDLFTYLCKPAYERTDIFAVRSDLRATNQIAVQP